MKLFRLKQKQKKKIAKIKLLTKSLFTPSVFKQVKKPLESYDEPEAEGRLTPSVSYIKCKNIITISI